MEESLQDKTIKDLLLILSNHSKKKYTLGIVILGIFAALFDIIFVASLKEYIGYFTNDNSIFKTKFQLDVAWLTMLTAFIILISFTLKLINLFAVFVFSESIRSKLSVSLTKSIVLSNSSTIESFGLNYYKKLIVNEVDRFSEKTIAPLINAAVQSLVLIGLFAYLLYLNYLLTVIIISIVIIFYVTISYIVKSRLNKFSQDRLIYLNKRLDTVDSLIELNDELKEKNTVNDFLDKFYNQNLYYSKITVQNNTIAASPRFLLECFIFLVIVLSLLFLQSRGENFVSYIPLISAFLLAFYKMIPSAQLLYNAFVLVQSNSDLIKKIKSHLKPEFQELKKYVKAEDTLRDVCSDLNITCNGLLAEFNIIYGKSGVGKSTMLYKFYKDIDENKAYVKQSISLIDGNIYENIRLGDNKILDNEIERYLDIFHLNNIERDKNLKILKDTISGGEKQRIGIIRALVSKPDVLILDETLSGINPTLKALILEYLQNLNIDYIFIISHDSNIIDAYNSIEVIK
jgi:ABC-type multidrug transport system fused ATPase/permease subunit